MCSESKAFSLSREDKSDDQILSCLHVVKPLSAANRGDIFQSAMCRTPLPTSFDKRPTTYVQPRETVLAKKVNMEM